MVAAVSGSAVQLEFGLGQKHSGYLPKTCPHGNRVCGDTAEKAKVYVYMLETYLALEQEQFRTDAKCADGYVILGGHHLLDGRWFSFRLLPGDAPFLFDGEGRSQWASTSAELLATMVALVLFGLLDDRRTGVVMPVVLSAGTDNQSNEFLMRKGLTTRWPLMMINMQLSELLMQANARLHLSWRPRSVSL